MVQNMFYQHYHGLTCHHPSVHHHRIYMAPLSHHGVLLFFYEYMVGQWYIYIIRLPSGILTLLLKIVRLQLVYLLKKMVMFHSFFVCLPEGIPLNPLNTVILFQKKKVMTQHYPTDLDFIPLKSITHWWFGSCFIFPYQE